MTPEVRHKITVKSVINSPVEIVWELWTNPKHIINWNNASDDWYTPRAENDPRTGGRFLSRMEARDGSFGFNFSGVYSNVEPLRTIEYVMDDGRKVSILFISDGQSTLVNETFEAEQENPVEMQRTGWQAILDNFRKYAEKQAASER